MIAGTTEDLGRARRLEQGMVLVRWFGVALGVFLVSQSNATPPPHASRLVLALAYAMMGLLALGNVAVSMATTRTTSVNAMRWIGIGAFALDSFVLLGMSWLYTYNLRDFTWVVLYILPLEGALRYRLHGALVIVLVTLPSEIGREAWIAHRFGEEYPFVLANVALRVGIQAIIALVAGFMARSLAGEAEKAAEQARRFEDAAKQEASARRELSAFNTAILLGVATEDVDTSIRLMTGAIGRDLGFETLTIMVAEEDHLVVKGMWGMPFYESTVPFGQGVTGTVAATGRPLIVPDVKAFPGYIMVDPTMRSEMAVPMRFGDEIIGVVDVESRIPDAFDEADVGLLTRLADQFALVVHAGKLYERQKETVERLQELDQMKSDFIAIASHELRTPLTAINGYVKTLQRRYELLSEQDVRRFLETIERQAKRMSRLVEDLLLVSRLDAGTIRLSYQDVPLAQFMEETAESFGPDIRYRIQLQVNGDGPVRIDPDRVAQIVKNLVANALKFSPEATPVSVTAARNDGWLQVEVSDQGVGIPPDELPRIFERFHQAGPLLTREAEGAGLGLYITKRLVEVMDGTIDVESTPGEGTTFWVRLPVDAAPEDRAAAGNGAARKDQAELPPPPPPPPVPADVAAPSAPVSAARRRSA